MVEQNGNPAARLSAQERGILLVLLARERGGWNEEYWGTRLHGLYQANPSRSWSASCSRSLRRLERRGFVERKNQQRGMKGTPEACHRGSQRATHVALTEAGRTVAKDLADANG